MDKIKMDERFKSVLNDRRFASIKQNQSKVKIDSRFQSMFTDDRFKLQYKVDKRGKPLNQSSSDSLKKYYRLSRRDAKKLKEGRKKEKQKLCTLLNEGAVDPTKKEEAPQETEIISLASDNSDSDESEDDNSSDEDDDFARGEGNIESSSEEDEEEEFFAANDDNGIDHHWGEIDADAERSDDTSHRLALCNMDWDRVKAVDLLVLLDSFKPANGTVKRVSIYPSEFGIKRMAEESLKGPAELTSQSITEDSNAVVSDLKEGERFQVEKLRQYQINRLKYYYAVVECDSKETADAIYQECDGMEYELSSTRIDLRFVPDDTTFDEQPPKDVAEHIPAKEDYKPAEFFTTALNQSKVDLTWDETDRNRLAVTMRRFKEEELENLDLKDFLASSSESEEEPDGTRPMRIGISSRTTDVDQIARYRSLLLGDDDENELEDNGNDERPNDVDMEITWDPMSDDKQEEIAEENEGGTPEAEVKVIQSKKRKKHRDFVAEEVTEEVVKERAQLELLMEDSEDANKKHFNLDDILKQQKSSKKKKRKTSEEDMKEDHFKINKSDDRFSAVFTSSDFAIDPNNPAFKKTKGMQELLDERLKRLNEPETDGKEDFGKKVEEQPQKDVSISQLVESIKAKTKTRLSNKRLKP